MINYNNKKFRSVANSASGEVSAQTIFHYWQEGSALWGTYKGGSIRLGTLIAKVNHDGSLNMRYQHLSKTGEFKSGICHSTPEVGKNGKLRLHEKWQWTSGSKGKGESIIEETG